MPRVSTRRPLYVVKFTVPTDWKLSKFLQGILSRVKSIVYIHRVADYKNQWLDKDVFIGLHKKEEFETLQAMAYIDIHEQSIAITCTPSWELAAAKLTQEQLDDEDETIPAVMHIYNTKLIFKVTSVYLFLLAQEIEGLVGDAVVTGVLVMFDTIKLKTRDFGYVSFLNPATATRYSDRSIEVASQQVYLYESLTVPVIISQANKELIENKPLNWNPDLKMANWLVTDLQDDQLDEPVEVDAPANQPEDDDNDSVLSLDFEEEIM